MKSKKNDNISIFDEDLLRKQKEHTKNVIAKSKKKTLKPVPPKELKWFQVEITPGMFKLYKDKENNIYAQHNAWKKTIFIGPYSSKDEVDKVIADYCKNSNLPYKKKKEVKNLRSVIFNDTNTLMES